MTSLTEAAPPIASPSAAFALRDSRGLFARSCLAPANELHVTGARGVTIRNGEIRGYYRVQYDP